MANRKQINTKSGQRLYELIKQLDLDYPDFADSVNLSEHTIKAYVSGTRRLTEDNARIITKKYPLVRYEWLMGWDDYKTQTDYDYAQIVKEGAAISAESDRKRKQDEDVDFMLREMGYAILDMPEYSPAKQKLVDYMWNSDFLERHEKVFQYFFSKKEIEYAKNRLMCKCMNNLAKEMNIDACFDYSEEISGHDEINEIDETDETNENTKKDFIEHKDDYLNEVKEDDFFYKSSYKKRLNSNSANWSIIDNTGRIVAHCNFAERELFMKEFYDVTNMMILGFIERQKQREDNRTKRKTKKED